MPRSSIETLDVSMAGHNSWMIPVYLGFAVLAVLIALFHPLFRKKN